MNNRSQLVEREWLCEEADVGDLSQLIDATPEPWNVRRADDDRDGAKLLIGPGEQRQLPSRWQLGQQDVDDDEIRRQGAQLGEARLFFLEAVHIVPSLRLEYVVDELEKGGVIIDYRNLSTCLVAHTSV